MSQEVGVRAALRWRPAPLLGDALLAAGLCATDLFANSDLGTREDASVPALLVVGYAVLGYLALIWRRRAPIVVFTVLWLHSFAAAFFLSALYDPTLGVLAALYTVAATRPPRVALAALVIAIVPSAIYLWRYFEGSYAGTELLIAYSSQILASALVLGGVWGTGRWARSSRELARHLEYRREAEAREAVDRARAQIARELHDIVAHSVTVMLLQAAGARRVLGASAPALAAQALGQIEEQGKQATRELRQMLSLLRGPGATEPPAGGQPSLDDLDELVAQVRRAGIPVRVEVVGGPRPLPPVVGLAGYRLVQEALTNVSKHAGPGTEARVRLIWSDELVIEISNHGPDGPPEVAAELSTGHGLLGLRERVTLSGGRFDAAPTPGGGFRVSATLPLDDMVPAQPNG